MALLCKRGGAQFAAYLSKSSSSSRCMFSRTLAGSSNVKRVVNNNNTLGRRGRWAVGGGAVRGYSEDASLANSSLSDEDLKKISAEVEMLRNELKESCERMQFQFGKLRDEIEEKIKESPPLDEELRSEIDNVKIDLVEEHTEKAIGSINVVDEKITGYIRLVEEKLDEVIEDMSTGSLKIMLVNLSVIGGVLIAARVYG